MPARPGFDTTQRLSANGKASLSAGMPLNLLTLGNMAMVMMEALLRIFPVVLGLLADAFVLVIASALLGQGRIPNAESAA